MYAGELGWLDGCEIMVPEAIELAKLERACRGRTLAQRRDYAIICVFRATGIRLSELAGIRYDPDDPQRSDVDLGQREITVRGVRPGEI
jgi:site-specific recombinase XerC